MKPWLWWFSNAVVLAGSLMYARVRQLEMATQHRTESKVEEKEETEPLQKVAIECVSIKYLFAGLIGVAQRVEL